MIGTLIYQSVNSQIDQSEFQANIAALAKWADIWYTLNNTPLNTVQPRNYKLTRTETRQIFAHMFVMAKTLRSCLPLV